ncbi:TetR/AcrR family transcriptional regulator [Ancylobacter sp. 6x-1]|uniref:TetR/AcrR family transcriptional regulator n=1 Tax=Ancylobacter crimeensis TaxID=2579147 RepID=A0ABT0DFR2_9HYPH|nr:TetR/AcrR family transcriptional regulator [Ancylobacter crimeensis]MCK0198801.1 TetR/AcrR family transcriptional regulator [Ancylobacter crimeensis]
MTGADQTPRATPRRPPRKRPDAAARRQAILDAALAVFAEKGFAGARMEDVARRAGTAKGTLYLHFKDKAALFEGLVRTAADPVLGMMEAQVAQFPGSTRDLLVLLFARLHGEIICTPRRHIVRLLIGEGERFPELADFYFRTVVARGQDLLRAINARALARGEITSDAALRFPQLIIGPFLTAVIWIDLFERSEPLDAEAMLAAHIDVVLRGLGWRDEGVGA